MHRMSVDGLPILLPLKGPGRSAMPRVHLSRHILEEHDKLNGMLHLLFPCTVSIQRVKALNGHLHSLRHLALSNGVQLLLKRSPSPTTALLRRERLFLETEARALALLGQSANPCIPQLYHYSPRGDHLGTPFLVRQYVMGSTLQDLEPQLTPEKRKAINRHLGFLANMISQHVAPTFGSLEQVASGRGKRSWREAFLDLFEAALRDAEDMYINLPYTEMRIEVSRLAPALEDITLPRLVVVDLGRPSQVILDPESQQVLGIVDFSSALWADVLMGEMFESLSPDIVNMLSTRCGDRQSEEIRSLLYACYRSVLKITAQYYRHRDETKETNGRRELTSIIASMSLVEMTGYAKRTKLE